MTATNIQGKSKEEMVEQMGVFFEQRGLTPIHGRVFAYLLLAEPPHKDFYEIQAFLKASKSAISNALKFLINQKLVKYTTFSGDRRRYFQVDMDGWLFHTKNKIRQAATLNELVSNVLETRSDQKYQAFNQELKRMNDFNVQLTVVLDQFIEKWNQSNE